MAWTPSARRGVQAVVAAACSAFAVLAVASGADRAALTHPAIATRLPAAFAVRGLKPKSLDAIARGDLVAAERLAAAAVRRDPVDPGNPELLGSVLLRSGASEGRIDPVFRVAGQMGWRNSLTQLYWMEAALHNGAYDVAATRLDALLRQDPQLVGSRPLLQPFEQIPEAEAALAQKLAARPGWLHSYLNNLEDEPAESLLHRAALVTRTGRRPLGLACSDIAPLTGKLAAAGRVIEAYRFWAASCPERTRSLVSVFDQAMLQQAQPASPFEWFVPGASEIGINLLPANDGTGARLAVSSTASFVRTVAMQLVPVAPGTYRLAWRSADGEGRASGRIVAALACSPDAQDWLASSADQASGTSMATVAADASCQGRWLKFAIQPGPGEVTLGAVTLRRVD